MPLTGERSREYQREYKRRMRASTRAAASAIIESLVPKQGRPSNLSRQAQAVGQAVVQQALEQSNLTLRRLTDKVAEKLDAEKPVMLSVEGEKGTRECINTADNDAQLRACDLALKLHERAGTIPAAASSGPTVGHMTVNILRFDASAPQALVVEAQHNVLSAGQAEAPGNDDA